ncbi:MAG: class I SAM-dependent methyltransferase [Bacteroidota bacterium]
MKTPPGRQIPGQGGESPPRPDPWEEAYLRFETPEEEIRKFTRRLRKLGAAGWPRDAGIADLFCGRGGGLHALERLGFRNLWGVDISEALLAEYRGKARLIRADCRALPLEDACRDIAIVQGGLHHLGAIPADLDETLAEAARILRPGGLFVMVEPWWTPFLAAVHWTLDHTPARRFWAKLDALAVMTEHEHRTYYQWLRRPETVRAELEKFFRQEHCAARWGKILYTGKKRERSGP